MVELAITELASLRQMSRTLLFITNTERLSANVGGELANRVLAAARTAGHEVLSDIGKDIDVAAAGTRSQAGSYAGIVILGGYDVVPSQRLDCIPASLRHRLGAATKNDADDFLVWSDDLYGDTDGDGWPERPVSRVPDGHDRNFFLRALSNTPRGNSIRFGIRNTLRDFADVTFLEVPGDGSMLRSLPTTCTSGYDSNAKHVYLMLHGSAADGCRFWGEPIAQAEAVNLSTLAPADVVFTGCCWGALVVEERAVCSAGARLVVRRPTESVALSYLSLGANAFIGCTGAHYSPTIAPYRYAGGPMHAAFWQNVRAGRSPAEALFSAKSEYRRDFPHGRISPREVAVEYKILREYTCLGVGW